MTSNRRTENSAMHLEVSALLPWYVNETLEDQDRQRVDAHVSICAACREDLAAQRRIHEAIAAQPALDYVPVASLKRLRARLDAAQSGSAPRQEPATYRVLPWRGWMAASIAVVAVAAALVAAGRWVQVDARRSQPSYRTVTSSAPRPRGEVIRAVFSPNVTLVELQSILDEAQLRIVSGPSEAGVYSLASNSPLTVRASLALLRRHSTVRFAEETLTEPAPGDSP